MFEIKLTRSYDGRYVACVPDLHPSIASVANTAAAAVRMVQAHAFSILSDFVKSNRQLPDAMRCWFHTVGVDGTSTQVGGCQQDDLQTAGKLIHPANDVIPAPRARPGKPDLPRSGTLHDQMVADIMAGHVVIPSHPPVSAAPTPAQPQRAA